LSAAEATRPGPAPPRRRVLAVASGGGHWVQLRRILPAFADLDVTYVTIKPSYRADVPGERVFIVRDATRWDRLGLVVLAFQMAWILIRVRPHLIVSTGALPGLAAIVLGRLTGRRTIWLDSIANVDELSMSGRLARRYADLWLTQWPHLAGPDGPEYAGRVF